MYPKTRAMIHSLIEDKTIPGANYQFITKEGIESYSEGLAAVFPQSEPIKSDLLYDVASLTKVMMTTTVILQLWETGQLKLTDPVKVYLPTFSEPKVTIQHLLTHTSALQGFIPNRDQLNQAELKEALLHLPIGEGFEKEAVYTDSGMILLGFIIEAILKDDLVAIFNQRIIQPLDLKNTTFSPRDPMMCAPTENHQIRGLIRGVVHDPKALVLGEHCGSAGLFSNLQDVSRFSQMLLNRGTIDGVEILKEETVTALIQDWTPSGTLHRSLGWDLFSSIDGTDKTRYLFHSGFTGTFILLDLAAEEGFVFLSNRVHPINDNPHYLKRRNEVLQAYFHEKEAR